VFQHVQPPSHEKVDRHVYADGEAGYNRNDDERIDPYGLQWFDDADPPDDEDSLDSSTQPESEDEDACRDWKERQLKKERRRQQLKKGPRGQPQEADGQWEEARGQPQRPYELNGQWEDARGQPQTQYEPNGQWEDACGQPQWPYEPDGQWASGK